jgi:hypothetical protein
MEGTGNMITQRQVAFLKLSFIIGVIADFAVGVNWLLIALGYNIPSLISSFEGAGVDYRFAMYISTMFMFSWVAVLAWGVMKPLERRGLLPIVAAMLTLSIIIELLCYQNILSGAGFVLGIIMRVALILKFTSSYVYSLRKLQ